MVKNLCFFPRPSVPFLRPAAAREGSWLGFILVCPEEKGKKNIARNRIPLIFHPWLFS